MLGATCAVEIIVGLPLYFGVGNLLPFESCFTSLVILVIATSRDCIMLKAVYAYL